MSRSAHSRQRGVAYLGGGVVLALGLLKAAHEGSRPVRQRAASQGMESLSSAIGARQHRATAACRNGQNTVLT